MAGKIEGGCLCGACRYATTAAPINVRLCHCRLCQKAIGASFNVRVLVPLNMMEISGPVGWYASSTNLRRGFCSVCGSTLFSERRSNGTIGVTLGSLDDPNSFAPTDQIWTSSKQQWLVLDNALPAHSEAAPV